MELEQIEVHPILKPDKQKFNIAGSVKILENVENHTDDDILGAILRLNYLETANCVSKDTFRTALRWVLNRLAEQEERRRMERRYF